MNPLKDEKGYVVATLESWKFETKTVSVIKIRPETYSIAMARKLRDWVTEAIAEVTDDEPVIAAPVTEPESDIPPEGEF